MHEITSILVDMFIIFTAAKIAGGVFAWLKQSSIVGEGLAGIRTLRAGVGWGAQRGFHPPVRRG